MASEEIARRGSSSQASASVISRPHDRLGLGVIFAYNVPTIGLGYMFLLVNMYLMKFATDELLIAPSTMGLLFGLSRIWDAVTDPLAGYFSDRTNTRLGRRRPWILVSIVPIGLAFAMVWSPPLGLTTSSMVLWVGPGTLPAREPQRPSRRASEKSRQSRSKTTKKQSREDPRTRSREPFPPRLQKSPASM